MVQEKKEFICICPDKPDVADKRIEVRPYVSPICFILFGFEREAGLKTVCLFVCYFDFEKDMYHVDEATHLGRYLTMMD